MVTPKMLLRALAKLERKLKAKIRSVAKRGTIGSIATDGERQTVQTKALADDVRDDVELFEPYGFTSGAPAGSECLIVNVGADQAHGVAIMAGGREYRIAGVGEGEVAVYHRDGAAAVFRNDGSVEIYGSQGQPVRLGTPVPPAEFHAVAREGDPVNVPALDALATILNSWVPPVAPTIDNGAALKTALTDWLLQYALGPTAGDGTITEGGLGSESA